MTIRVNVLQGFSGHTIAPDVVEVIDRKVLARFSYDKSRGVKKFYQPGKFIISYKGRRQVTFILPAGYGEAAGLCISI